MVYLMCFCYILPHFTLRFAAKHTAFWCILHCILVQNTLRFGAKCNAFWCILRGRFAVKYVAKSSD